MSKAMLMEYLQDADINSECINSKKSSMLFEKSISLKCIAKAAGG
jgi:hypothetical protein